MMFLNILSAKPNLLARQVHHVVVVLATRRSAARSARPIAATGSRRCASRPSRSWCRSAADRCRPCARTAPRRWSDADRDHQQFELLHALTASGIRVTVLPPWPMMNIAWTGLRWSIWSFGSNTASNQRVLGMPGRLHQLLARRSATASNRSRPPKPGTSAASRLRPDRNRAAGSSHRGRGRWRPARWYARGRCWRRCPALPTLPVASSRMQRRARWRCRRSSASAPMHQISVAGFCLAKISAMRLSCARARR